MRWLHPIKVPYFQFLDIAYYPIHLQQCSHDIRQIVDTLYFCTTGLCVPDACTSFLKNVKEHANSICVPYTPHDLNRVFGLCRSSCCLRACVLAYTHEDTKDLRAIAKGISVTAFSTRLRVQRYYKFSILQIFSQKKCKKNVTFF